MPPEQITHFRRVQPAADQYSTAATLYQLLTGKYVYDLPLEFEAQLKMILEDEPVPIRSRRPDISPKLAAVVHRALEKDPAKRFADVREMHRALSGFRR
jgi:serine/threonine-protein kinase